jgi:hypothetical protein
MKLLAVLALLVAPLSLTGCTTARQKCINAVVKEYEAADKVLQQPSDLDGFCAAWNDHPPGIDQQP